MMFNLAQAVIFHTVSVITALLYLMVIVIQLRQFKVKRLQRLKLTLLGITVLMFLAMVVAALFYWSEIFGTGLVTLTQVGTVNRFAFLFASIGWLAVYTKFEGDE